MFREISGCFQTVGSSSQHHCPSSHLLSSLFSLNDFAALVVFHLWKAGVLGVHVCIMCTCICVCTFLYVCVLVCTCVHINVCTFEQL